MIRRHAEGQSRLALRFFLVAACIIALGGLLGYSLVRLVGEPFKSIPVYPWAFLVSTSLLASGSMLLQRALAFVRRERQRRFRVSLQAAVAVGMLFLAVQSYGLWSLLKHQDPAEAQTGPAAFVSVFTGLHGLHFTIALLFVVFVTLRARAERYDHEYHWGVVVAAAFWHALGLVWLAIVTALIISMRGFGT